MIARAAYLPSELLLEILKYIQRWDAVEKQTTLFCFTAVNRQWYDVAVSRLYEAPYLSGKAYELFIRTICPSVLARIKPTALSSLIKTLDLSHIVHQGNKSTTARLLSRTKGSLEVFIAPQASFAINCWASLSKCMKLRVLDLSLVSESIRLQSLSETMGRLPDLQELYLPRCSSSFQRMLPSPLHARWPPKLQHLSLSGPAWGNFLWDMMRQPPNHFPPSFHSLSILHSPGLERVGAKSLLCNLAATLTVVELRDLPAVRPGHFNRVLDWLPHLVQLTIALDYMDFRFGHMPAGFSPTRWRQAKPLHTLTIVSSGQPCDPRQAFSATELYALMAERFLGRLRYLHVAHSTEWHTGGGGGGGEEEEEEEEGEELWALEALLLEDLDRENWEQRRWHYQALVLGNDPAGRPWTYARWIEETELGRRMRPRFGLVANR